MTWSVPFFEKKTLLKIKKQVIHR